jgi:hypothetical protein
MSSLATSEKELHGRQELVAVSELILAELRRRVTQRAEQFNQQSGVAPMDILAPWGCRGA